MEPVESAVTTDQGTVHIPATSTRATRGKNDLLLGIWRLSDPKISLASISAMLLGACLAAARGSLDWGWLSLTVLGILFLEAAKNASGDVFDYDSGADKAVAGKDRSPFSGGKRVIVDGLLTRAQTIMIAAFLYAMGIVAGLAIVIFREPGVFWLGLAGVALAYFYNAPPLKLSYRGFGELAVAIVYGPLICTGTYLVQQQSLSFDVILVSVPLGILIAAFLVINEFPDRKADRSAGKRNLVVRLGARKASRLFLLMVTAAGIALVALPLAGLPNGVWLALAGLVPGAMAAHRLRQTTETTRIIPAQRWALIAFVLTALGCGTGVLLS